LAEELGPRSIGVGRTAGLERLGEPWLDAHPDVPWRLITGMRNRIAHDYWTIDDEIVSSPIVRTRGEVLGSRRVG
jgi:uncharacterized protein with HEPN domain